MGSATSCFNSTLYRKTMTRFWPLWALYGVIWAFLIPLNLLNQFFWLQERYQGELDLQSMLTSAALDIPYLLTMGVALSLVFGALAAMASSAGAVASTPTITGISSGATPASSSTSMAPRAMSSLLAKTASI